MSPCQSPLGVTPWYVFSCSCLSLLSCLSLSFAKHICCKLYALYCVLHNISFVTYASLLIRSHKHISNRLVVVCCASPIQTTQLFTGYEPCKLVTTLTSIHSHNRSLDSKSRHSCRYSLFENSFNRSFHLSTDTRHSIYSFPVITRYQSIYHSHSSH